MFYILVNVWFYVVLNQNDECINSSTEISTQQKYKHK